MYEMSAAGYVLQAHEPGCRIRGLKIYSTHQSRGVTLAQAIAFLTHVMEATLWASEHKHDDGQNVVIRMRLYLSSCERLKWTQ